MQPKAKFDAMFKFKRTYYISLETGFDATDGFKSLPPTYLYFMMTIFISTAFSLETIVHLSQDLSNLKHSKTILKSKYCAYFSTKVSTYMIDRRCMHCNRFMIWTKYIRKLIEENMRRTILNKFVNTTKPIFPAALAVHSSLTISQASFAPIFVFVMLTMLQQNKLLRGCQDIFGAPNTKAQSMPKCLQKG